MKRPWSWNDIALIVLFVLLFVSYVLAFVFIFIIPLSDGSKVTFLVSALLTLAGFVVQERRDRQAHERDLELKSREQSFTLGIVSHMAVTVFDKEVVFCEKYSEEANRIVSELLQGRVKVKALDDANALSQLRKQYSLWIPSETHQKLYGFESSLRKIGASSMLREQIKNPPSVNEQQLIETEANAFMEIMGWSPITGQANPEAAIEKVNEHLRGLLGADKYLALREYALNGAERIAQVRTPSSKVIQD